MTTVRVQPNDEDTITLPRSLMERYGLKPDDSILVEEQPKRIVIRTDPDPFEKVFAAVKKLNLNEEDWEEIHKERHRDDEHWM